MKTIYKGIVFCLLLVVAFSLLQTREKAQNRYVTDIQITFYRNDQPVQIYHYTTPGKISSVLTYLRLLKPRGVQPPAPARADSHSYRILLSYSDQTDREYLLHDYTSFSQAGAIWKRVKPAQSQLLYPLLQLLSADE